MEMRNCPKCGKLFSYASSPICKECEKNEEQLFNDVKDFINENPKCTIGEVVEATKVSSKKIMRFIKEGRLEISKGMEGEVGCDQCGKPIKTGKFCEACAAKINNMVTEMYGGSNKRSAASAASSGGARMHLSSNRRSLGDE